MLQTEKKNYVLCIDCMFSNLFAYEEHRMYMLLRTKQERREKANHLMAINYVAF